MQVVLLSVKVRNGAGGQQTPFRILASNRKFAIRWPSLLLVSKCDVYIYFLNKNHFSECLFGAKLMRTQDLCFRNRPNYIAVTFFLRKMMKCDSGNHSLLLQAYSRRVFFYFKGFNQVSILKTNLCLRLAHTCLRHGGKTGAEPVILLFLKIPLINREPLIKPFDRYSCW